MRPLLMRPGRTLPILVVAAVLAIPALAILRARTTSPPAGPIASLRLAPDIQITMYQGQDVVGGQVIALSSLWEQGKPVVLNFWAGLCPPCRAEMPDFERLYTQRPSGSFFLIGVDIGPFIGLGSRDDARALARELAITFPLGTTFDVRTIRNYEIVGMPTTVFITPDGRILRKHAGLLTLGQMNAFTGELLRISQAR